MSDRTPLFALHLNLLDRVAHAVSLTLAADGGTPTLAGVRFTSVSDPQEFLSVGFDLSHGDADAVLMAYEMDGQDEFWLKMDPEEFVSFCSGEVAGVSGEPFADLRQQEGSLIADVGEGCELDLDPMMALFPERSSPGAGAR